MVEKNIKKIHIITMNGRGRSRRGLQYTLIIVIIIHRMTDNNDNNNDNDLDDQ